MADVIPNNSSSSRRIRKGYIVIKGFAPDGTELYITRGDGFEIRGGTPETHARMLAVAHTIMDALNRRGYDLEHLTRRDYLEISGIVREIQDSALDGENLPPAE